MASHRDGARAALYETALDLFTRLGFEAVGVQQIVDGAGLTKPTLYHYFGSKRGLLGAVCSDAEEALFGELGDALDYRGDLPWTLEAIVARILRVAARYPLHTRLLLALRHAPVESEARRVIEPTVDRLASRIREIFRAASEQHGNMRGREHRYTASFMGVCFTYAGLLLDGYLELSDELPHEVMHQFSHGIYS